MESSSARMKGSGDSNSGGLSEAYTRLGTCFTKLSTMESNKMEPIDNAEQANQREWNLNDCRFNHIVAVKEIFLRALLQLHNERKEPAMLMKIYRLATNLMGEFDRLHDRVKSWRTSQSLSMGLNPICNIQERDYEVVNKKIVELKATIANLGKENGNEGIEQNVLKIRKLSNKACFVRRYVGASRLQALEYIQHWSLERLQKVIEGRFINKHTVYITPGDWKRCQACLDVLVGV